LEYDVYENDHRFDQLRNYQKDIMFEICKKIWKAAHMETGSKKSPIGDGIKKIRMECIFGASKKKKKKKYMMQMGTIYDRKFMNGKHME
jgi:hypothetical protein